MTKSNNTSKRGRKTARTHRSGVDVQRMARRPVTITLKGYTGPGWTFSVTGSPEWAKRMVRKYVPLIQQYAKAA